VLEEKAEDLVACSARPRIKALRRQPGLREDQAVQQVLAEAERLRRRSERVAHRATSRQGQVETVRPAAKRAGNPVYQQMVAAQANFRKTDDQIMPGFTRASKKARSPIITSVNRFIVVRV